MTLYVRSWEKILFTFAHTLLTEAKRNGKGLKHQNYEILYLCYKRYA